MTARDDHSELRAAALDRCAMRRQVILDTLRAHTWSSARMLSDRILEETGGRPVLVTAALWLPPWTVYEDLKVLERQGKVERRQFSSRVILWSVAEQP